MTFLQMMGQPCVQATQQVHGYCWQVPCMPIRDRRQKVYNQGYCSVVQGKVSNITKAEREQIKRIHSNETLELGHILDPSFRQIINAVCNGRNILLPGQPLIQLRKSNHSDLALDAVWIFSEKRLISTPDKNSKVSHHTIQMQNETQKFRNHIKILMLF